MKPDSPNRNAPLSLQDKLDHISREREVLAVRRELARDGLHEGDMVFNVDNGEGGRLVVIARNGAAPYSAVRLENGTELPFDKAHWNRPLR